MAWSPTIYKSLCILVDCYFFGYASGAPKSIVPIGLLVPPMLVYLKNQSELFSELFFLDILVLSCFLAYL